MGKKNKGKQGNPNKKQRAKNKGRRNLDQIAWKTEFFKLSQQLRPFNLHIREITGDGNCLFRAISDQLTGEESAHEIYRNLAVEFMIDNRPDFEPFIEDDKKFDEYIANIRKLSVWGGNLEIQALSLALTVNIKIHMLGQPIWEVRNHDDSVKTIHLSYHDGDHYNSVRLIGDDTHEPARSIPDVLRTVKSIEQAADETWNDAVEYSSLILYEENKDLIKRVLMERFHEAPSIDAINEFHGSLINDVAQAKKHGFKRGEIKEEIKEPEPPKMQEKQSKKSLGLGMKPAKLPTNNEKCWCGSNKKYKTCCKASDSFRESEPEKIIEKLETLQI